MRPSLVDKAKQWSLCAYSHRHLVPSQTWQRRPFGSSNFDKQLLFSFQNIGAIDFQKERSQRQ
jgi:hypothetical protein